MIGIAMPGANLIFHLTSAILLMALVAALIRLKNQRDFLRRLLSPGIAANGLIIAAPQEFFQQFANACQIALTATWHASQSWQKLQKIQTRDLVALHAQWGIRAMHLHTEANGSGQLRLQSLVKSPSPGVTELPKVIDLGFSTLQISHLPS